MTVVDKHRDVALRLLVSRSLPEVPWGIEEDRVLVIQERVLWAELGCEEQASEQEYLAELWRTPAEERWVSIPSKWGLKRFGARVLVPDRAFGDPEVGVQSGVVRDSVVAGCEKVMEWLRGKGFLVVTCGEEGIILRLPAHRVSPESDRLLVLLSKRWPHLRELFRPWGIEGGVSVWATYDPVGGMAVLKVRGLTDAVLIKSGLRTV